MIVSSWSVPSMRAGRCWPEASSQVRLAGEPLQSPPMDWAEGPVSRARPTMKPDVTVTRARRPVLCRFIRLCLLLSAWQCHDPPAPQPAVGCPHPLDPVCARFFFPEVHPSSGDPDICRSERSLASRFWTGWLRSFPDLSSPADRRNCALYVE